MSKGETNEEKEGIFNGLYSFKNIILAVLTVLTAINSYKTTRTKDALDIESKRIDTTQRILNIQTNELDNLLKKKEFENNLKLKMYEEAKSAIGKDSFTQAAALILINEMLKDDSSFLWKLKSIISRVPETRNNNSIQEDLIQFSKVESQSRFDTFTIDVFYLDELKIEAEPRARQINDILSKNYPNYKVRLRLLPKSINIQNGYRISQNLIRFEKLETSIAQNVLNLIVKNRVFPLEQPTLQQIKYLTPNYISIFVRNM